ncbi:MAG: hypothetical protein IPL86_17460 [Flavobacteriales bacterium]|nr:hypothetical protein [Flavobacteriales bacterium]
MDDVRRKGQSSLHHGAPHRGDEVRKGSRSTRMEAKHTNMQWSSQTQPDLKEVLNAALATLPEVQRSVVLRDPGRIQLEIAELTQLNVTQVKVYIYRGRTALKDYIGSLERAMKLDKDTTKLGCWTA